MTEALALAERPLDYPNEWPPGSGLFAPSDRQALAHELAPEADELLYGGARGGGKTDWALAEAIRLCAAVPGVQVVLFRRTNKELTGSGGAVPRLLARAMKRVARYNATEKRWTFWNGSVFSLSYLETVQDVQGWLGLEIQLMIFDQVEQLDEETYVLVRTSLRATGDVAAGLRALGTRPRAIATANPGGRGHVWVKKRFVDPFPLGGQLFRAAPTEAEPTPMVRCYVPAKLSDNPALDQGDPSYRAKLEALGVEDRAAMLDGDWDVFKGARFSEFRTRIHVRDPDNLPLEPPGTATRAIGIDYGNDSPFVALWGCLLADDLVVVYREVWARGLSPAQQAALVLDSEEYDERSPWAPLPAALDPACWAAPPDKPLPRTGGVTVRPTGAPDGSIAWHYVKAGVPVERADNRRLEGATLVASMFRVRADGLPRILISSTCTKLIETLPSLQRDPKRPEDVIKGPDDHWYDALRYLVMKLLWTRGPQPPTGPGGTPIGGRGLDPSSAAKVLPSGIAIPEGRSMRGLRRAGF